ncbi:AaceriABL130Cp [[Ashbya] aceris (nom. inval.)]|nr:AaceriABL130Cp [[Ashbya] aceris (nom. inval.)]
MSFSAITLLQNVTARSMDSLEARLKFIEVIKSLHKTLNVSRDTSPSSTQPAATEPVHFYLMHYEDHYEDFHSCLFEVTASMDSLDRLNVLIYWSRLVSSLWPRASKDVNGQPNIAGRVVHDYLLKDLGRMLALVLPEHDWKALTNLPVATDVFLHVWRTVGSPSAQDIEPLTCRRESFPLDPDLRGFIDRQSLDPAWRTPKPDASDSMREALLLLVDRRAKAIFLQEYYRAHGAVSVPASTSASTILHRMESDRERHKKSKEHLWFTDRDSSMLELAEFDALWQQHRKGMTRDDYQDVKQLQRIAQESYLYQI